MHWLIITLLISWSFSETNQKPLVAVMDFQGENLQASDVRAISRRFQSELSNTGMFQLLDRTQMDALLKEQGFQSSGVCDGSCQVEMGQLLGAEKLITGSVSQVGSVYSITANLVDITTGSIERSESLDIEGSISSVLTELAPRAAFLISGKKAEPPPPKAQAKINWLGWSGAIIAVGAGITTYMIIQDTETKKTNATRTLDVEVP